MPEYAKTAPLERWLMRLDGLLERGEGWLLSVAVLLMAALAIANVAGRNLFGTSFAFVEEFNQILMVLITFGGIGYGVRHARHIRMSALYDQLEGRWRKGLMLLSSTATGLLLLLLAWYGIAYAAGVHQVGSVTPALRIPLWLVYTWVPLGLAVGALQYLLAAWRNLATPGVHLSFQQPEAFREPGEGG